MSKRGVSEGREKALFSTVWLCWRRRGAGKSHLSWAGLLTSCWAAPLSSSHSGCLGVDLVAVVSGWGGAGAGAGDGGPLGEDALVEGHADGVLPAHDAGHLALHVPVGPQRPRRQGGGVRGIQQPSRQCMLWMRMHQHEEHLAWYVLTRLPRWQGGSIIWRRRGGQWRHFEHLALCPTLMYQYTG